VQSLSNGCNEDWRVVMADTGRDTLTGSRISRALRYIDGNTFLATYGDGVSDIDLDKLLAHHRASGRLATVTAVRPSSRFGELSIDGNLVTRFREKPQVAEGWINGGFFVFDKRAFDRVRLDDNVPLEEAVLETLAGDRQLAVYKHHGFWQSMDTYREMTLLNELWADDRAPWHIWKPCRLSA
jgi:glucose-1-phosphate cytidylyltransferase